MENAIAAEDVKYIKEGNDPFNGDVILCEDTSKEDETRYWVEHQRKEIYTDFMTLPDAEAKYNEFVNDTIFA